MVGWLYNRVPGLRQNIVVEGGYYRSGGEEHTENPSLPNKMAAIRKTDNKHCLSADGNANDSNVYRNQCRVPQKGRIVLPVTQHYCPMGI